ncbi:protein PSK SIMULATOR 1 [Typha angustifolia]|uniref:protein PSK SIMULATOR 1 n=1 Tax=Typha angustifolia TaxID=59011 RepID=UPI003C2CB3CC
MRNLNSVSWFGRVGLTHGNAERVTIGVLAFEIASLLSKTAHLWHSLDDDHIVRLRNEVLRLEGVRKLVSDDDDFLLGLALAEMTHSVGLLSRSVARLGKRCSDPLLQQFDLLFADLIKNDADPYGLRYAAGKKMGRKVKKMERLVAATSNLYQELEVLGELEQALRRPQASTEFRQKVVWQRQEVKYLRGLSLWNRTHDYTVRLLGRSLFTIVARIKTVFGFEQSEATELARGRLTRSHSTGLMHSSVHPSDIQRFSSGPLKMSGGRSRPITASGDVPRSRLPPSGKKKENLKTKWPVSGMPFKGCMVRGTESPVLQSCILLDSGIQRSDEVQVDVVEVEDACTESLQFGGSISNMKLSLSMFASKSKFLNAPPSTLGAAALPLHYANVIIVIEKLVMSPHLIGLDARDDLYDMLPTSIRAALRARLKSYAKNLASSVYDPALAAEWTEAITRILEWLAPLAHNMIRWQSDRNFEQRQHVSSGTNILLLQTLYFANQLKTEAAITELLVGLNYLWRYGRELSANATLECVSSRNFDDSVDSRL